MYELLLLDPLENPCKLLLSVELEDVTKSFEREDEDEEEDGILFLFLSILATAGEVEDATSEVDEDEIGRLFKFWCLEFDTG